MDEEIKVLSMMIDIKYSTTKEGTELLAHQCRRRLDEFIQEELEEKLRYSLMTKYSDNKDLYYLAKSLRLIEYVTYNSDVPDIKFKVMLCGLCKNGCDPESKHLVIEGFFTKNPKKIQKTSGLYVKYQMINSNDVSEVNNVFGGINCSAHSELLARHGLSHNSQSYILSRQNTGNTKIFCAFGEMNKKSIKDIVKNFGSHMEGLVVKKRTRLFGLLSKKENRIRMFLCDMLAIIQNHD